MKFEWRTTDPDRKQIGRQISEYIFEFKEDGREQRIIDLEEVKIKDAERILNSYGYTFKEAANNSNLNIYAVYGKEALWIVAECIYECTN